MRGTIILAVFMILTAWTWSLEFLGQGLLFSGRGSVRLGSKDSSIIHFNIIFTRTKK
jgi:hypothetical protein